MWQRSDVRIDDVDAAAYFVMNIALGVIHASLWSEHRPLTNEQPREQLVHACPSVLGGGTAAE